MARVVALFFAGMILLLASWPAFADGGESLPVTPQVRYSAALEKVRIVLDLPAKVTYTSAITPTAVTVNVATPLATAAEPITLADPVVTGITLAPDDKGMAVLTVALTKARQCNIFSLPPDGKLPFRIVIDVLKSYTRKDTRALSPAITYTRLEKQTDDRYYVAHIAEVDAKNPHVRLAVAAAQGDRERVASMVTRTQAVLGVNGGYFLSETRPVGLLQVDGRVISMPIWGRTALVLPKDGSPTFTNPSGSWSVTLPDGTVTAVADWLDASILTPAPSMRVIHGITLAQAPANPAGLTVVVRDGKIVARTTEVAPLNRGDHALFLTGDAVKTLDAQLAVGAPLPIVANLSDDCKAGPFAVGAGPRLLKNGQITITGEAERFKPDILTGRKARTGIGVTKTGRVLLMVVEEAIPAYGGGATLHELAALLKSYGAVDAMNLDGGGSSCFTVGAETVNYPPNTWIRPLASGVLVFDDRMATSVTGKKDTLSPASKEDEGIPKNK